MLRPRIGQFASVPRVPRAVKVSRLARLGVIAKSVRQSMLDIVDRLGQRYRMAALFIELLTAPSGNSRR